MIEIVRPKTDLQTEIEVRNVSESTVKLTGSKSGQHGGQILTVTRIADTWGSAKRTTGYDPQGDPRSFIVMVGEKTARFFGFSQVSETEMTIPDVEEFNGALNKINELYLARHGEPFTNISFYQQQTKGSKLATYIREWGENAMLPIAKDGNHFFHDISFHTSSVFLPSEVVQHGRKVASIFLRFLKSLDTVVDTSIAQRKAALAKYKLILQLNYAAKIDFYTGAVADGVIHYLASKDPRRQGDPDRLSAVFFQAAFGANYTARIALKKALEHLEFGGLYPGAVGKIPSIFEETKYLSIDELQVAFRNFDDFMLDRFGSTYVGPVNSRAEASWFDANSSQKLSEKLILEELCERLTERRSRVIEIVESL